MIENPNSSKQTRYRLELIQVQEKTQNPSFDYKKLHKFDKVTDVLLEYLQTAKVNCIEIQIIFKIYAYELVPK